jgi:hypothetical protein
MIFITKWSSERRLDLFQAKPVADFLQYCGTFFVLFFYFDYYIYEKLLIYSTFSLATLGIFLHRGVRCSDRRHLTPLTFSPPTFSRPPLSPQMFSRPTFNPLTFSRWILLSHYCLVKLTPFVFYPCSTLCMGHIPAHWHVAGWGRSASHLRTVEWSWQC